MLNTLLILAYEEEKFDRVSSSTYKLYMLNIWKMYEWLVLNVSLYLRDVFVVLRMMLCYFMLCFTDSTWLNVSLNTHCTMYYSFCGEERISTPIFSHNSFMIVTELTLNQIVNTIHRNYLFKCLILSERNEKYGL